MRSHRQILHHRPLYTGYSVQRSSTPALKAVAQITMAEHTAIAIGAATAWTD